MPALLQQADDRLARLRKRVQRETGPQATPEPTGGDERLQRLRERVEREIAAGPEPPTGDDRLQRLRERVGREVAAGPEPAPDTPVITAEVPPPDPLAERGLSQPASTFVAEEPADPDLLDRLLFEERELDPVSGAARVPGRVLGQFVEGLGGTMQALGSTDPQPSQFAPPPEPGAVRQEPGPGLLSQVGEQVGDFGAAIREAFPPSPSVAEGGVFQPGNWRWWLESGGEAVTQLGSQVALAGLTGGGSSIARFMAFAGPVTVLETGGAFKDAKASAIARGMTEKDAEQLAAGVAITTGLGSTALELLPFKALIQKVPGAEQVFSRAFAARLSGRAPEVIARVLTGAGAEGIQEIAQETWGDVVAYVQGQDPEAFDDFVQRMAAAGTLGALAGSVAGAGGVVADRVTDQVAEGEAGDVEGAPAPPQFFDELAQPPEGFDAAAEDPVEEDDARLTDLRQRLEEESAPEAAPIEIGPEVSPDDATEESAPKGVTIGSEVPVEEVPRGLRAAVQVGDQVFTGATHAEAVAEAEAAGATLFEDDTGVPLEGVSTDLFQLPDGELVDRAEADRRFGADQSEDLVEPAEEAKQPQTDISEAFTRLGAAQRDAPEQAMRDVQQVNRGGEIDFLTEHVGDLINRMTKDARLGPKDGIPAHSVAEVQDKVRKTLDALDNPNFERFFRENLESSAEFQGRSVEEHTQLIDDALAQYAAAHRALPVYNRPQWLAREAAVAIGEKRFDDATQHLKDLEVFGESGALGKAAMRVRRDAAGALVEFNPDAISTSPRGDVLEVAVSDIDVEPDRFQFKSDVDASGAGAELKGVERFDPDFAGVIQLWRDPADGRLKVVNGHNRLALARRTGEQSILGRVVTAESADDARVIGALTNVAEGRGTALDAAKLIRSKGFTPETMTDTGISLQGAIARDGLALSHLPDGLFGQVASGRIPVGRGVAIGGAGLSDAHQTALAQLIAKREKGGRKLTNEIVTELARFVQGSGETKVTQETLFGEEELTRSNAIEKAELSAHVKKRLGQDRRLFGFLTGAGRAERIRVAGAGEVDVAQAATLAQESASAEELYERLSTREGPIADALNVAARELAEGGNANAIRDGLYTQVREAVRSAGEGSGLRPGAPDLEGRDSGSRGRGLAVELYDPPSPAHQYPGRPAPDPLDPGKPIPFADRLTGNLKTPADPVPGGPVSAPQVMKVLGKVAEAAGRAVPIRLGRISARSARGVFKVGPEVIRIRTANNIPTSAHEVAHALEKIVFGWEEGGPWKKPRVAGAIQRELAALGKELYGDTQPIGGYKREGFAEFVRLWVTADDVAQSKAPAFTKFFEGEFSETYPEVRKALDEAREATTRWRMQGSRERAKQSLVDPASPGNRLKAAGRQVRGAFTYQRFVEMAEPLRELSTQAGKLRGTPLSPVEDPFVTVTALRTTHSARVRHMVEKGMIDLAGNPVGPGLVEIRALTKGLKEEFTAYMWARRAQAMWRDPNKPRDPGLSLRDADQIVKELNSTDFQLAAQKVYAWSDGVLDYAAQASPTFAKVIERVREADPGNYIPLFREMEELDDLWTQTDKGGGASQSSPVKRLKGSGRRVKDPFSSLIAQAERTVQAAHRRMVLDQILKISRIEGMGNLVEEVPRDMVPAASATIEELLERINEQLLPQGQEAAVDAGTDTELDLTGTMITFFAPSYQPKGQDPIVPIYEEGELRWFRVDGRLHETLSSMDVYRLPDIGGLPVLEWLVGKPTALMRAGTTGLRASFGLIWNPLRDVQTMHINSRANGSGGRILSAWMKSVLDVALYRLGGRESEFVDAFVRLGGEMSQPLGQDVPHTRNAARQLFQGRVVRTLDPRNVFDFYRDIIQTPEMAPRVAELRTVAEDIGWAPGQPMTVEQSMQLLIAAKQVSTDFTAAGSVARVWNRIAPYVNASIQGPRANLRAARRDPAKFMWRGLQLTAATLLGWWLVKDEEWYLTMPYREKFLNWHIPTDWPEPTLVRLPRAFETGMLFSALPEMAIDSWYRDDPEAVTEWFDTFREAAAPELTPVLLSELRDQWTNRDNFWDTPIVPASMERMPESEQFDSYTTRAAIALGGTFNVSPKRIDHALRGVAGPFSLDVLGVLGLGPVGTNRDREAADLPVIGRLFQRGGKLGNRPRPINDIYDRLETLQTLQHSEKSPETKAQRRARLQLTDATRAVSGLLYVRRFTPETAQRERVMREAVRIAEAALETLDEGILRPRPQRRSGSRSPSRPRPPRPPRPGGRR